MLGIYVSVPIACFRKGLAREYLETESLPPPSTCYGFLLSLVGETNRERHIGSRIAPVLVGEPSSSSVLRRIWRIKAANGWKTKDGHWFVLGDSERKALRKWLASTVAKKAELLFSADRTEEEQQTSWCELAETWMRTGQPISDDASYSNEVLKKAKAWVTKHSALVPVQGSGQNASPDYQQLLSHVRLIIWLDSTEESQTPNLEQRVTQALTEPGEVTRFGGLSLGESTHLVDEVSLLRPDRLQRLEDELMDAFNNNLGTTAFLLDDLGNLTLPVWVDHVGSAGTRYCTGRLQSIGLAVPEVSKLPQIQPPDQSFSLASPRPTPAH